MPTPIPKNRSNWFDTYMSWLLNPSRFGGGGGGTLIVYPDADPETTTVDGYMRRAGADATWATLRAMSANQHYDSSTQTYLCYVLTSSTTNQFAGLGRSIITFDTTSIPLGATISSATVSLYVTTKYNQMSDDDLDVVSASPASDNDLVTGDFTTLGTTALGTIAYGSVTTGAYNDISLDVSAINKGGITRLGFRMNDDRINSAPPWTAAVKTNGYMISYAENGAGDAPKLTVVYTT